MRGKIGIFGGTLEGRLLAEFCQERKIPAVVSVATDYGSQLLGERKKSDDFLVCSGRMNEKEMEEWMERNQVTFVADATHPFAREVTQEIQRACKEADIPYCRLIREMGEEWSKEAEKSGEKIMLTHSVQEAAERLKHEFFHYPDRNALIATGSKEISCFSDIPDAKNRLYIRVLPSPEAIQACQKAGFFGRHIIAMQGPFSCELNCALLREIHASYLVTKESGKAGGFAEKITAAKICGCHLLVVGSPPREEGKSLEEIKQWLLSREKREKKTEKKFF